MLLGFLVFPFLSLVSVLKEADGSSLLDRQTLDALKTTFIVATGAVLADAALGVPLALWMARSGSRFRHLATVGVLLALAVPPVVAGLQLVLWLGPDGWLGAWLERISLNPLDSLGGTMLAQMFVAAPFVIITARAALGAIEPGVIDAARLLGCSPFQALVRVMLPAARRGIAAGLVLGWLRAVGEFGASMVVAYHPYTLSSLTFVRLSGEGVRAALPIGALAAGFGVVAALALVLLDSRRSPPAGGARSDPAPAPSKLGWIKPGRDGRDPRLEVRVSGTVGGFALDVRFEAPAGAIAILGPSGAGKSLTLRIMAGLLRPASGTVVLAGTTLLDTARKLDVAPERRRLGYVAQGSALFEHLNVEGNVAFGLRGLRGLRSSEQRERVDELLGAFGLSASRGAYPRTLSGGEGQRVALARALAREPSALLLDEPFSSLDMAVRRELRALVREIHERTSLLIVLVTHDRDDALELADHVVVIDHGRVVQQGRIGDVFARPATRTVAHLVGIPNVLAVRQLRAGESGRALACTDWGDVPVAAPRAASRTEPAAWELAVPTDAVGLLWEGKAGVVASARPGINHWKVMIRPRTEGDPLQALIDPSNGDGDSLTGATCGVVLDPSRCHLMPAARRPSPAGARSS